MNISPSNRPLVSDTALGQMRAMMVEQQRNESIRAIALHLLSAVVPALHAVAFVVETKEIDFGPAPSTLIHMMPPKHLRVTAGAS